MLIRQQKAHLLRCIDEMVEDMGWDKEIEMKRQLSQGLQQQLFPSLSPQEQAVTDALKGCDYKSVHQLAKDTRMPMAALNALLLEMELKNLVHLVGGGIYRLP